MGGPPIVRRPMFFELLLLLLPLAVSSLSSSTPCGPRQSLSSEMSFRLLLSPRTQRRKIVQKGRHTGDTRTSRRAICGGSMEDAIDRQLTRLFDLLERKHVNHSTPTTTTAAKRMDLSVITQFLALDIVGDMTFVKPFGFLDDGEDIYDWIRWNEGLFQAWPFSKAFPKATDKTGLGCFIRVAQEPLEERFRPGAPPQRDMIDKFLKQGATKSEATGEALGAGSSSADRHGLIRDAEAKKMPYLQAVIRESVRVFASQTPLLSKTVPAGGDVVAGFRLPAGTAGRDGRVGHPPEQGALGRRCRRVPAGTVARGGSGHRGSGASAGDAACLEALFGYGRFKCLGRSVAFMQLGKALPEMSSDISRPRNMCSSFRAPSGQMQRGGFQLTMATVLRRWQLLRRYGMTIINPTRPVAKMHSAASG
ncbi:hypothetical protein Micbo1qcDRAFT_219031 [Microdochium bolleyi]|uniref:Cytochrome P450 n=1 Tax=Microdochium bolleyi TaxID=196109 RepID=A0A136INH6_9PEZI|nr:hypothetical protein Micbo1qcDRAFT_219031 [Microdochium bolleyi]